MSQRKSHIAPLAFLMLIFFVSPMTVKAVHHHVPRQISAFDTPQGKSISEAVGTCPVCQFEFVSFIPFDNPEYIPCSVFSTLNSCEGAHDAEGNSCTLCSLRAPPLY